jgi:hypothetical protein
MTPHNYTDGVDLISRVQNKKSGYLLRGSSKNTHLPIGSKGFYRRDEHRSIKEWYEDSKKYARQHPVAAFMSILSVFFGLAQF